MIKFNVSPVPTVKSNPITPSSIISNTGLVMPGPRGNDGREVQLRRTDTHIQWRYDGDEEWIDLVSLADLGELPIASTDTLGCIKVGENLTIDNDGVLSIDTSALRAYVDETILGGAS